MNAKLRDANCLTLVPYQHSIKRTIGRTLTLGGVLQYIVLGQIDPFIYFRIQYEARIKT